MSNLPKVIIFDFDGTLVHYHFDFLIEQTHRVFGLLNVEPVSDSYLKDCFSDFDYFRFAEKSSDPEFIKHFWHKFDWSKLPFPEPFSCTEQTLGFLKSLGIKLAVATARYNKDHDFVQIIEEVGISHYFDCIVARESEEQDWKDKDPQITNLVNFFKVDRSDIWFVGDVPADVISSKKANLGRSVAVLSGGIKRAVLEKTDPDYIFDDIGSLIELFNRSGE